MKLWQIDAPGSLKLVELAEQTAGEGEIKIKMTKIGISRSMFNALLSEKNINYPVVPSHQAVGLITEAFAGCALTRGQRVIIEPFVPCKKCVFCLTGKEEQCEHPKPYGVGVSGLLRDFIVLPEESVYQLPDHIKDHDAIFIEHIATALNALGKLEIKKGDHIAIVGNNITALIMAQAAIYYQAVPIFIDTHAEVLDLAQKLGIYYTVNAASVDPVSKLFSLTGGKMCEHTAFFFASDMKLSKAFDFTTQQGNVCFVGWDIKNTREPADLSPILDKHLTVSGITNAGKYMGKAINLLASRAIDVSHFCTMEVDFLEAASIEEKFAEVSDLTKAIINVK